MRIAQLPSGEYYIEKTYGSPAFVFRAYAKGKTVGSIKMGEVHVPKGLVGKKLMFKVEVMKWKKKIR